MNFSGPVQPPMLGAAIASARIHLSPDIERLQSELRSRIDLRDALLDSYGVPVMSQRSTPICFVAVGDREVAYRMVERLLEEGYYANPAVFPAVSVKRAGVRFTVTRHHTFEDIRKMVGTIARLLPEELSRAGSGPEDVYRAFGLSAGRSSDRVPA